MWQRPLWKTVASKKKQHIPPWERNIIDSKMPWEKDICYVISKENIARFLLRLLSLPKWSRIKRQFSKVPGTFFLSIFRLVISPAYSGVHRNPAIGVYMKPLQWLGDFPLIFLSPDHTPGKQIGVDEPPQNRHWIEGLENRVLASWRVIPGLGYVVRITPIYYRHKVRPFGKGTLPQLGDETWP